MDSLIDPDRQVVRLDYIQKGDLEIRLQAVVDALSTFQKTISTFIAVYPKFRKNRLSCIPMLNETAASLDEATAICNIFSAVFTTAGVVGALGLGAALTIGTGGLAAPFVVAAASGGGLATGGLGGLATYFTQKTIEKKHKSTAEKLLDTDKEYAEKLMKYVVRTDDAISAVEDIVDYEIFEKVLKAFEVNGEHYKSFKPSCASEKLPESLESCIEELQLSDQQKNDVKELFSYILQKRRCSRLIMKISSLFVPVSSTLEQTCNVFDDAARTMYNSDARSANQDIPLGIRFTKFATRTLIENKFLSPVTSPEIVYALNYALSQIPKDWQSEIAKNIRNSVKQLSEELDVLENLYEDSVKIFPPEEIIE